MSNQNIPPFPPSSLIKEGTIGTCPSCHSTELRKYNFYFFSLGEKIGCINPDCQDYYVYKQNFPYFRIKETIYHDERSIYYAQHKARNSKKWFNIDSFDSYNDAENCMNAEKTILILEYKIQKKLKNKVVYYNL